MISRVRVALLPYVMLGVVALGSPNSGAAQTWFEQATVVTFAPLPAQPLGRSVGVSLRLTDKTGARLSYRRLEFFLDDNWVAHSYTNREGVAKVRLGSLPAAGRYTLRASFAGHKNYLSSAAVTPLEVTPAVFTASTVPPLAGVTFSFGGRVVRTGEDGVARISVAQRGTYRLEALPWHTKTHRATFARWQNGVFESTRTVEVPNVTAAEAGFDVEQLVEPRFADLDGVPVAAKRVSAITLRSSYGAIARLPARPAWLQVNQIVRRPGGLEAKEIRYTLERVMVDGSNVVNRGQQRFSASYGHSWNIELLLYHARFRAVDAVFGFPLGTGVALEYPDGEKTQLEFNPANEVEVGSLARGLYAVQVLGASGLAPQTPVALSRDQKVELKVLSRLDMVVFLVAGVTLALSLLLIGRPQLIGLKRRPGSFTVTSSNPSTLRAPLRPERPRLPSDWR